jgi:hypothetical protein
MMKVANSCCVYGEERERELYKLERPPSKRGGGGHFGAVHFPWPGHRALAWVFMNEFTDSRSMVSFRELLWTRRGILILSEVIIVTR